MLLGFGVWSLDKSVLDSSLSRVRGNFLPTNKTYILATRGTGCPHFQGSQFHPFQVLELRFYFLGFDLIMYINYVVLSYNI